MQQPTAEESVIDSLVQQHLSTNETYIDISQHIREIEFYDNNLLPVSCEEELFTHGEFIAVIHKIKKYVSYPQFYGVSGNMMAQIAYSINAGTGIMVYTTLFQTPIIPVIHQSPKEVKKTIDEHIEANIDNLTMPWESSKSFFPQKVQIQFNKVIVPQDFLEEEYFNELKQDMIKEKNIYTNYTRK